MSLVLHVFGHQSKFWTPYNQMKALDVKSSNHQRDYNPVVIMNVCTKCHGNPSNEPKMSTLIVALNDANSRNLLQE